LSATYFSSLHVVAHIVKELVIQYEEVRTDKYFLDNCRNRPPLLLSIACLLPQH